MGFDGLVVTDALDMGGVTVRYPPGEGRGALRSSRAGCPSGSSGPRCRARSRARCRGVRPHSDVASRRSRHARSPRQGQAWLKQIEARGPGCPGAHSFDRPEFDRAALDIADRGITLLRDDQHILPLDATKPTRVLLVAVSGDNDPYPAGNLENEIRWRVDSLASVRMDTRFVRADNRQASFAGHVRCGDCRDLRARRGSQRQRRPARTMKPPSWIACSPPANP